MRLFIAKDKKKKKKTVQKRGGKIVSWYCGPDFVSFLEAVN